MNKRKEHAFGRDIYLIGKDKNGRNHWIVQGSWDCEWYWGFGYVQTYTNNNNPAQARDIETHSHFDSMFFNGNKNGFDNFKDFFVETPFTDSEIWEICELMKSFYIARNYADMVHVGGAHYTENPAKYVVANGEHYNEINKVMIPTIMDELYKIMID